MSTVFGLYCGNSTASVAVHKEDGRVEIIANDAGDRTTSTSVFISSNEKVVGLATGGNVSRLSATVTRNKSLLDLTLGQEGFDAVRAEMVVKPERDPATSAVTYTVPDARATVSVTPSEVSTLIFKKLYSIGQSSAGDVTKLKCVMTVPQWWSEETRRSVRRSAESAGWTVLQIMSECSAALLAYLPTAKPLNVTAIVFRVGGYSCEATAIQVVSGFYRVLGSERREAGVRSLIDTVTKHLADEFRRKTKLEASESRKSMWKLWSAAETMVRSLSTLPTASLYLESLCEGVDFTASLSRARLDSLLSSHMSTLIAPLHALMQQLSLHPQQVDKVVYAGGGLNMPRLRREVSSVFGSGSTEVLDYLQPQEVTAVGAATQGGFLSALSHLPPELERSTLPLSVVKPELLLETGAGERVTVEGALPLTKSLTVNLEESASSLTVTATQGASSASVTFDGFDSTPTPLRINLDLDRTQSQLQVLDLSTGLSQTSPLILSPSSC